jgi:hypothetical protein
MLDLNSLVAIDIHTHADGPCGTEAYEDAGPMREAMKAYFKHDTRRRPCRKSRNITASEESAA